MKKSGKGGKPPKEMKRENKTKVDPKDGIITNLKDDPEYIRTTRKLRVQKRKKIKKKSNPQIEDKRNQELLPTEEKERNRRKLKQVNIKREQQKIVMRRQKRKKGE